MKNLKIAALALFATAAMSAQDLKMNDVPKKLSDSFKKNYPQATGVEWEMDQSNYNVEFNSNGMEHEIWYSKDGKVMKSEIDLAESDLPSAIASAIKSKYADFKIDSIEMKEENGTKTYEVELEKGWDDERNVIFSANGDVVSDRKD